MKDEQLKPILYALTLRDRGREKRGAWLAKGFQRMNRREGALLDYWKARLAASAEARAMAAEVRAEYEKAREAAGRLPGAGAQARNLAAAVVAEGAAVLSGKARVTEEEYARRLALCMAPCKRLDPNGGKRCLECGCYVKTKTAWRSQACPIGRW